MDVALAELQVADPPEVWRAAGFEVDSDDTCRIGTVRVRLLGRGAGERGKGVAGWTFRGAGPSPAGKVIEVDGIATGWTDDEAPAPAAHPNGVTVIDHVVVLTPALARTVAAIEQLGLDVRRERDGVLGGSAVRQVFFRAGEVVLEVVGDPDGDGPGPAHLWGITYTVEDVDRTAALLADHVGRVKDAVQPGRRITTLRHRDAGLSVATAFISARPPRA